MRENMIDRQRLREDFDKVLKVLENVPTIDKTKRIGHEEFALRRKKIYEASRKNYDRLVAEGKAIL